MFVLVALICTTLIIASLFMVYLRHKRGSRSKGPLLIQVGSFFAMVLITTLCLGGSALAASEAATEVAAGLTTGDGLSYIGAALAVGLSGIGGGIAVSSSAAAAIGAISENENTFGKAMIFVAMAEGVALYGLIIALLIIML